jgi:hypothetical protein
MMISKRPLSRVVDHPGFVAALVLLGVAHADLTVSSRDVILCNDDPGDGRLDHHEGGSETG